MSCCTKSRTERVNVQSAVSGTLFDGAPTHTTGDRDPHRTLGWSPSPLLLARRLRMTAVDAVTSPAGVCLGNRFPTADIAKTACEPPTTAPRLPETNNYQGSQSATADLMWPLTGFAIGTIAETRVVATWQRPAGRRQRYDARQPVGSETFRENAMAPRRGRVSNSGALPTGDDQSNSPVDSGDYNP